MKCIRCDTWLAGDHVEEERKFLPDGSLNVHTHARCADVLALQLTQARHEVERAMLHLRSVGESYSHQQATLDALDHLSRITAQKTGEHNP